MLFEKRINREVERRMYEENLRREMWERLERQQKQIEELRFAVECMKQENACVNDEASKAADEIERLAAFHEQIMDGHLYYMRDGVLYKAEIKMPKGNVYQMPPIEADSMTEHHMTNAMKIRLMSDEELAQFITATNFCDLLCDDDPICKDGRCDKHLLDWLKQEATND